MSNTVIRASVRLMNIQDSPSSRHNKVKNGLHPGLRFPIHAMLKQQKRERNDLGRNPGIMAHWFSFSPTKNIRSYPHIQTEAREEGCYKNNGSSVRHVLTAGSHTKKEKKGPSSIIFFHVSVAFFLGIYCMCAFLQGFIISSRSHARICNFGVGVKHLSIKHMQYNVDGKVFWLNLRQVSFHRTVQAYVRISFPSLIHHCFFPCATRKKRPTDRENDVGQ